MQTKFKYIYGPVSSWRLGSSLGIDLLAQDEKICSFNCIYCQLGDTKSLALERKRYVKTEDILAEIKVFPELDIDYITFSGRGEPTLAENLGEVISGIRKIRKEPLAILTNSSLFYNRDVREALKQLDFVIAKIDAFSEGSFKVINRAHPDLSFRLIVDSIKKFREQYSGRLGIQIMFLKENQEKADEIVKIVKEIKPDAVQLNTPLRPSRVNPISIPEMVKLKSYFKGLNTIMVYEADKKKVYPVSEEETLKRRGKI